MADPNRPNRAVTLVKLLGAVGITGVLAAGVLVPVLGGVGLTGKAEADRFLATDCTLDESAPSTKTTLLANDGTTVIAQFFAQNRTPVTLDKIPKGMQQALIATEDRRFYEHKGVDPRGLARAAVNNSESGDTQGGSTLTMQYVKQLRYYNAKNDAERAAAIDQTVERKIQDAKCALDLEKRESKDEILTNYFNIAFFGENSYGVQAAATTYFNKDVSKLTLAEAAMIVGLVQAPTEYDPFVDPQKATDRRNTVVDNMVASGDISAAKAAQVKALPLGLAATSPPEVKNGCFYSNPQILNAGFFCDYAQGWLESHGIPEDVLLRQGLTIKTTLDANLQSQGQDAVWNGEPGTQGGPFADDSPSSLIMPSLDPKTGNVLTMITSRRYGTGPNQTAVPLFTTAAAGAGSTYKYFTTLLAMEAGATPSYTLTAGAPYSTKNCPQDYNPTTGQNQTYVARNAGNYNATLPLETALYQSSNTYFVGMEDMLFDCYTRPIADLAVDLGMTQLNRNGILDKQATFTLGQDITSPLQLTAAYATVANDGTYCEPNPILAITDRSGNPVEWKKVGCAAKIAPQIAREVVQMLIKDTTTSGGTATSEFGTWYGNGGSQVASKTGTNNATGDDGQDNNQNSAIWFVGLTPNLTSAAAVYNFKSPTKTISGLPGYPDGVAASDAFGAAASRYWLDAYGGVLANNPWSWPSPDAVSGIDVPNVTGRSPAEATATLEAAGFKVEIFPFACGSRYAAGQIMGYGPQKAEPGTTVTACVSNGKAPNGGYNGYTPGYNDNSGGFGGGNGNGTNGGGFGGGFGGDNGNGNGNGNGGGNAPAAPAAPGNGDAARPNG